MEKQEYYLEHFKSYLLENDKSEGTIKNYLLKIKSFIKYYKNTYDENLEPNKIIIMELQDYRSYLLNVKRLKASTINNYLSALKEYFLFLNNIGLMNINPSENLKKIKLNHKTAPESLTLQEYRKLKREVYKYGSQTEILVVELLANLGVRVTELISICKSDIKISERSGSIRIIGKNRKERIIPLNSTVRNSIKKYLVYRNNIVTNFDILLISQRKKPFTRDGILKILKKYEKRLQIHLHPHKFRHFFSYQYITNPNVNTSLHELQYLLGHESLSSTSIYLQVQPKELEEKINHLNYY